jgi:hypothetical protein
VPHFVHDHARALEKSNGKAMRVVVDEAIESLDDCHESGEAQRLREATTK